MMLSQWAKIPTKKLTDRWYAVLIIYNFWLILIELSIIILLVCKRTGQFLPKEKSSITNQMGQAETLTSESTTEGSSPKITFIASFSSNLPNKKNYPSHRQSTGNIPMSTKDPGIISSSTMSVTDQAGTSTWDPMKEATPTPTTGEIILSSTLETHSETPRKLPLYDCIHLGRPRECWCLSKVPRQVYRHKWEIP